MSYMLSIPNKIQKRLNRRASNASMADSDKLSARVSNSNTNSVNNSLRSPVPQSARAQPPPAL